MTAPAHPLVPAAKPAGPRPPQWQVVAASSCVVHLAVAGIAVGIGVLVAAWVLAAQAMFWSVDRSFVVTFASLQHGIPFVVALALVRQHMFTFVPQGATRPAVVSGNLASAPVAGLVWAAAGTVLLALEALAFRVAGWEHAVPDAEGLSSWERGWWFVLLVTAVNATVVTLGGQVVGALFYRLHGDAVLLAVLLTLPVVASLLAVVALGTRHDLEGPFLADLLTFGPGAWGGAAVVVAVVVVLAGALALALRGAPARSRS